MTKQATDCACGERRGEDAEPVVERLALEDGHALDAIESGHAGRDASRGVRAARLAARACRRDRRLPEGARVVFTGCGTSFHAAQTGGWAVQALEAVLAPPDADLMVCVSHEGSTPLTLEAARAFRGPVWLVTGAADSPLAELADEVVVCTPEVESRGATRRATRARSRRSRRCAARTSRGSPDAVEAALAFTEPRARRSRRSSSPAPAATGRPRRRRC